MKTPVPEPLFSEAKACNFIKKRLWHRCFSVNFTKLLRTAFFQNSSSGCFCNEICLWGRWNPSIKMKMVLFLARVFLITNSLKAVYLLSKMRFYILIFSGRFWSFKCNISSFCIWYIAILHCLLQYVTLLEKFWTFY